MVATVILTDAVEGTIMDAVQGVEVVTGITGDEVDEAEHLDVCRWEGHK